MLREVNYEEVPWEKEVQSAIDKALEQHKKIKVKIKTTAKGEYVVIYAYDENLYRNVIFAQIKTD